MDTGEDTIQQIINNSVWRASSIEDTPELELIGGRIYEVSSPLWIGRTRHFSGYNITEMEGRASSAIIEFDSEKMIGKTRSGRIYKLSSELPRFGQMGDIAWVWDFFVRRNQLFDIIDVTEDYVNAESDTTIHG